MTGAGSGRSDLHNLPPRGGRIDEIDRSLDDTAWKVVSDLCTPDGVFASLPPEGLQQLIQARLEREAKRLDVPLAVLVRAFERAVVDLTGKNEEKRDG